MAATLACRTGVISPLQLSATHRTRLASGASSISFQAWTPYHGVRLPIRTSHPRRSAKKFVVEAAHNHVHGARVHLHAPRGPLGAEHALDDFSRFLYYQVKRVLSPYVPPDFDPLAFLPESIHNYLHRGELAAIIFVREVLHIALFYFLFCKVDRVCKYLNWLYKHYAKVSEDKLRHPYEQSSFRAAVDPLKFLILVFAGTRLAHVFTRVMNIEVDPFATGKLRSIGLVLSVAWYVFNLKKVYVEDLVSKYRTDAPRIIAFDKVVGLLIGLIALTCIGDVTGFGLRSLLAVGGASGVAIGLASKEIVSNFFGGAVLFITRPFVIGERIKAGQFTGYVQDIGFLQTKILNMDRNPMTIPNQNFINQAVTNYSRATGRILEGDFNLRVDEIFRVERITARIVAFLKSHPDVDEHRFTPVCYLDSIGMTDLKLDVKCLVRPTGGAEFYRTQQSILLRIAEIIAVEGSWVGSNPPPGLPAHASVDPADIPTGVLEGST